MVSKGDFVRERLVMRRWFLNKRKMENGRRKIFLFLLLLPFRGESTCELLASRWMGEGGSVGPAAGDPATQLYCWFGPRIGGYELPLP
jgi:hypothetical protein